MSVTLEHITETLAPDIIDSLLKNALEEDLGAGDVTTTALIPEEMTCRAKFVCMEDGIIAGLTIAERVFQLVDERIQVDLKTRDGEKVQEEQIVMRLFGPARGIVTAERVALNFLQHMSGIATLTGKYVKALAGTKTQVIDTR